MTIATVGTQAGGVDADNATSVARAFGSNVAVGNLVSVVCLKYSPSNDAFVSGDCTKSAGTATLGAIAFDANVNFAYDGGAAHVAVGIWSAIVTGAGSCTMQVAGAAAGSFLNLVTDEYSATGGWDSSRLDGTPVSSSNATDNSTPATTGNMTSTAGGLFLAGTSIGGAGGTVTITPDAAFTQVYEQQDSDLHNLGSVIRRIVTGSTTDQGEWTLGTTHVGWTAALVIYKEVGGGPTTTALSVASAAVLTSPGVGIFLSAASLVQASILTLGGSTQRVWRVPTTASNGTAVHVTVFSGTTPTYSILAQGATTVDASGFAFISASGNPGDKALAFVHNYDDNTATTSIFGGAGIATIP